MEEAVLLPLSVCDATQVYFHKRISISLFPGSYIQTKFSVFQSLQDKQPSQDFKMYSL